MRVSWQQNSQTFPVRMVRLSVAGGEILMIFWAVYECDRQTDGQMNRKQ